MDINDLKSLAESRFDHALHRRVLRERIHSQLFVTHNGGQFKATKTLLSFLSIWDDDVIVIEDIHKNPIQINRPQLLIELKQAYQYAMNAWHQEFEESKRIRKGKDVV